MPDLTGNSSQTPIHNSYWVEEGKFLAGEYPRHLDGPEKFAKLRALEAAGISLFLDLTELGELLPYCGELRSAEHLRFPIRDVSVPRADSETTSILNAIDAHLESGGKVYLHCWGGVGRTGTIVGCWLARKGYVGDESLARLAELWGHCPKSNWKGSPSTGQQRDYIRNWRG